MKQSASDCKDNLNEVRAAGLYIILFLFLSAGLSAVGYFSYQSFRKNYLAEAERQLSAIAELKVSELVRWRKERMGDGEVLYNNPVFSRLVKRGLRQPEDLEAKQQLRIWLEKILKGYEYSRVFFLDSEGIERLSVSSRIGLVAYPSSHASEVIHAGRVLFTDFHRHHPDGPIVLSVQIPVFDESGTSSPLGVCVLQIDPSVYLYPFIQNWPVPSDSAETLLIRREGNEAVFLNELRFKTNAALNLRISLASTNTPAVMVALGQNGVVQGVDYRGHPVLAALHAIPDSPWFIVARRDIAEVFAPVRERLWQTVVMIGILLFGAAACAGMIWRHQRAGFYREKAKSAVALREANDYLENLINYANAPIIVWDPQFRITRFNHAFEKIAGLKAEDVLGKGMEILFAEEQREQAMAIVKRAGAGESFDLVEVPIQNTDGSQRLVLWNSAPIFGPDGRMQVATIAQGHDITERNRMKEELAMTQETLKAAMDHSSAGIAIADAPDGKLRYVNDVGLLIGGKSREQLVDGVGVDQYVASWNIFDLNGTPLPPEKLPMVRAIKYGEMNSLEFIIRRGDHDDCVVLAKAAPIANAQGKITAGIVVFLDITERRETTQKLYEAMENLRISNRDLEQFAYIASHDLQEPLRMVANYMQLIERRYKDKLDQDAKDFIGYAVDGAVRMQQLIDSLLDYSRLQTRKNPFAMVSLEQVLQRVLHDLEGRIIEAGAQVTADPLPQVYGDALQIGLVLQNLITNAVKFRGEASPKVHIAAVEYPKHWKLTVSDNGIGIAPEHQERIFKIFQRLHSRAEYPGTGIGLAVCRRIIERHGGETGVESELTKGSTFWVTLLKKGEK